MIASLDTLPDRYVLGQTMKVTFVHAGVPITDPTANTVRSSLVLLVSPYRSDSNSEFFFFLLFPQSLIYRIGKRGLHCPAMHFHYPIIFDGRSRRASFSADNNWSRAFPVAATRTWNSRPSHLTLNIRCYM